MDANDGSSGATQPAQDQDDTDQNTGFLGRLAAVFRPLVTDKTEHDADVMRSSSTRRGMVNLRRMRVEDVAITKAEIEAVVKENPSAEKFICTGIRLVGTSDRMNLVVRKRAKEACDYAKELNPKLSTWYQSKTTKARSYNGRVLLVLKTPGN